MIGLRDFTENDIDSITRHANNINVSQYMASSMPYPFTVKDAKWWIETGCTELGWYRAIDLNGECIGVVGVHFGKFELQYSAEIGYWLSENFWGRGIATEAVAKMTDLVFSDTEITRVSAPVFSPNKASMRVLEKCGYSLEAIHKNSVFKNEGFMDEHVFVRFR